MTVYEAIQLGYQLALAALTLCVLWQGSSQMKRTVLTIVAVMVASLLMAPYLWPGAAYSAAMVGVNAVACVVITWHPAGKWQSVVGFTYILQIGVHIGKLAATNPDLIAFWRMLSILAFIQLFLVGGWLLHDRLGHRFSWGRHRPPSPAARRSGVD